MGFFKSSQPPPPPPPPPPIPPVPPDPAVKPKGVKETKRIEERVAKKRGTQASILTGGRRGAGLLVEEPSTKKTLLGQ